MGCWRKRSFPTATDDELGTGKWSAGPGFVVFLSDKALHVTTGFLILNLFLRRRGPRERECHDVAALPQL